MLKCPRACIPEVSRRYIFSTSAYLLFLWDLVLAFTGLYYGSKWLSISGFLEEKFISNFSPMLHIPTAAIMFLSLQDLG